MAETSKNKVNPNTSKKMAGIALILIVAWIASLLISIVVWDRSSRQDDVNREIAQSWGSEQLVAGPILAIPFGNSGAKRNLVVLPDNIETEVVIEPEIRSRGIFESVVYTSRIKGVGTFSKPDLNLIDIEGQFIDWSNSAFVIGLSDTRGIADNLSLTWQDKEIAFEQGSRNIKVAGDQGILAPVNVRNGAGEYSFSFEIRLRGSNTLTFLPLAKQEKIVMQSTWQSPSFIGTFLPTEREVSSEGFSATWSISSLSTLFPEQWIDDGGYSSLSYRDTGFGVRLHQNIDLYSMVNREN